jgi:hypothetical protein
MSDHTMAGWGTFERCRRRVLGLPIGGRPSDSAKTRFPVQLESATESSPVLLGTGTSIEDERKRFADMLNGRRRLARRSRSMRPGFCRSTTSAAARPTNYCAGRR